MNSLYLYTAIVVLIQLFLCNFVNLGTYISISLLPGLILCLPLRMKKWQMMIYAFVISLVIDAFGIAVYGLTACSLLPVAFFYPNIAMFFFGMDCLDKGETISFGKYSSVQILSMIFVTYLLFFAIYFLFEPFESNSFLFILFKIIINSLISSFLGAVMLFTSGRL